MGAIYNKGVLAYGYCLGGPADGWSGLANGLTRYSTYADHSWLLPQVPWVDDEMDHMDHVSSGGEELLAAAGLSAVKLEQYSIDHDEELGLILAAVVHEPTAGPAMLDVDAMAAAALHDASLARALSILGLRTHADKPQWIRADLWV
ncbi:MAG: hypothetical protein HOV68_05365 [Streptomycetaceae bacterium]|nr:hypothetical protein [Streptomycetaceae bacterium]